MVTCPEIKEELGNEMQFGDTLIIEYSFNSRKISNVEIMNRIINFEDYDRKRYDLNSELLKSFHFSYKNFFLWLSFIIWNISWWSTLSKCFSLNLISTIKVFIILSGIPAVPIPEIDKSYKFDKDMPFREFYFHYGFGNKTIISPVSFG